MTTNTIDPSRFSDEVALPHGASPCFDPADYADDLADFGLTEAQQAEFLEALWNIMGAFARMGFTVDVCGLILGQFNEAATPEYDNGKLHHSASKETPSATGDKEAS
jgi:hypothetical protein